MQLQHFPHYHSFLRSVAPIQVESATSSARRVILNRHVEACDLWMCSRLIGLALLGLAFSQSQLCALRRHAKHRSQNSSREIFRYPRKWPKPKLSENPVLGQGTSTGPSATSTTGSLLTVGSPRVAKAGFFGTTGISWLRSWCHRRQFGARVFPESLLNRNPYSP